jgi:hypothetical protein
MRLLRSVTIAIALFNSTFALANNCPADSSDWKATQANLQWTIFDDPRARSCYFDLSSGSAYQRLVDCNDSIKGNRNGAKDHLNNCWPDNVCNWVRANHAPGC